MFRKSESLLDLKNSFISIVEDSFGAFHIHCEHINMVIAQIFVVSIEGKLTLHLVSMVASKNRYM